MLLTSRREPRAGAAGGIGAQAPGHALDLDPSEASAPLWVGGWDLLVTYLPRAPSRCVRWFQVVRIGKPRRVCKLLAGTPLWGGLAIGGEPGFQRSVRPRPGHFDCARWKRALRRAARAPWGPGQRGRRGTALRWHDGRWRNSSLAAGGGRAALTALALLGPSRRRRRPGLACLATLTVSCVSRPTLILDPTGAYHASSSDLATACPTLLAPAST